MGSITANDNPNTSQVEEKSSPIGKIILAAIALLLLAGVALFYGGCRKNDSIPASARLEATTIPAVAGSEVSAKFFVPNGEKLPSCLGEKITSNGKQYFNNVLRSPDRKSNVTVSGNFEADMSVFTFSFLPGKSGDYMFFPCRYQDPGEKAESKYFIRVSALPPVAENKPPAATGAPAGTKAEAGVIDAKLKNQIAAAVLADLKSKGLLLTEADRSKLDDAKAAKARADAAEAKIANMVPSSDFAPVAKRGLENAQDLKQHAEQMEVWKNSLATVESKVGRVQEDVRSVLVEQSIQKENVKSVATVTLELAKDVQGVARTKVNKTLGFFGGKEIKDTKEFKKVVDYRKQAEDLAPKIAELERIAGRYQNVVAQAPQDANGGKKLKKRDR